MIVYYGYTVIFIVLNVHPSTVLSAWGFFRHYLLRESFLSLKALSAFKLTAVNINAINWLYFKISYNSKPDTIRWPRICKQVVRIWATACFKSNRVSIQTRIVLTGGERRKVMNCRICIKIEKSFHLFQVSTCLIKKMRIAYHLHTQHNILRRFN